MVRQKAWATMGFSFASEQAAAGGVGIVSIASSENGLAQDVGREPAPRELLREVGPVDLDPVDPVDADADREGLAEVPRAAAVVAPVERPVKRKPGEHRRVVLLVRRPAWSIRQAWTTARPSLRRRR